jgi:hypothetical protein
MLNFSDFVGTSESSAHVVRVGYKDIVGHGVADTKEKEGEMVSFRVVV